MQKRQTLTAMALKDKIRIIPRKLIKDDRGWFLKAITGTEEHLPDHTGEVYLTMGKPGQSKAGHYHPRALEWFTVIEGHALLRLEDVSTHETMEIQMSLDKAISVYVPNNVAHLFVNTGNDNFIVLAYSDRLYDPADTIKFDFT